MEVGGQFHAPAALLLEKDFSGNWIEGCVGPRAGLDVVLKRKHHFSVPAGN
jgi:hypothetical protein